MNNKGDIVVFLLITLSLTSGFYSLMNYNFWEKSFTSFSENIIKEEILNNKDKSLITEQDNSEISKDQETISTNKEKDNQTIPTMPSKVVCYNSNCFQERFLSCLPAEFTIRDDLAENRLEIIGLENGKCQISFKYLDNPFRSLVGQEMFCFLDNRKNFEDELERAFELLFIGNDICRGDLVEFLTNPLSYQ
ncbi:MAG TPA: hypothetical protein ENN31_02155 [Candidatus Vogelbacteria bacterium]|nr:hypothetical protein [Candidatus Vogelbacteria bacterium]